MSASGQDLERRRWPAWGIGLLSAISAAFLMLRVPLMYRESGGQDEQWFAVPGYTVATEGVPRIPYVPERRRASVFYKADVIVSTLPPAYFYWQAPWFWVLPAGYGTARIASAAAGLLAVVFVYCLSRRITGHEQTAIGAAALYACSRVFFFPATIARPDMLCAVFGLAALCAMWRWSQAPTHRRLLLVGALCGLGLLTHPFAIVYCIHIGVWSLWTSSGWRRAAVHTAILSGTAALVLCCWLPLILIDPDAFREQFIDNVFDRSGPGFAQRLLWPWPYVSFQFGLLWEQAGPWQCGLWGAGWFFTAWDAFRRRTSAAIALATHTAAAVYLLIAANGHHPTKGYWCYPGALLAMCAAYLLWRATERFPSRPLIHGLIWTAGMMVMLPGMGLRAWWTHIRHWNEAEYNSPLFARQLIDRCSPDDRLIVDPAYVFDAWLIHPHVMLAAESERYFRSSQFSFDRMILSRYELDAQLPERLGTTLEARYGDRDALFACFAEIHRPALHKVATESPERSGDVE